MSEIKIERLIRSLGIGATYRGYHYLQYGISSYSLERDIRTVINVCWERGNRELLQKIAMHPLEIRPASSEFLDILTAHLKQKNIEKFYF